MLTLPSIVWKMIAFNNFKYTRILGEEKSKCNISGSRDIFKIT
jgi:hypothetical protein